VNKRNGVGRMKVRVGWEKSEQNYNMHRLSVKPSYTWTCYFSYENTIVEAPLVVSEGRVLRLRSNLQCLI
jgi:hypothetical protein